MSTSMREINQALADRLCAEAKQTPELYPLGRYVGIANGEVVNVSDDLDELVRGLRRVEPDPTKAFIVEPGRDYSQVVYI